MTPSDPYPYRYQISYVRYTAEGLQAFGDVTLTRAIPIETQADVKSVRDYIVSITPGAVQAILLNMQLLAGPDRPPRLGDLYAVILWPEYTEVQDFVKGQSGVFVVYHASPEMATADVVRRLCAEYKRTTTDEEPCTATFAMYLMGRGYYVPVLTETAFVPL